MRAGGGRVLVEMRVVGERLAALAVAVARLAGVAAGLGGREIAALGGGAGAGAQPVADAVVVRIGAHRDARSAAPWNAGERGSENDGSWTPPAGTSGVPPRSQASSVALSDARSMPT